MNPISRRAGVALLATLAVIALATGVAALQDRSSESRWAQRDEWQRPQDVMNELGLAAGSAVADVGAGRGYFTFRLAERVGATGKVYAVDISEDDLERIRGRAREQKLTQIEAVHGDSNDTHLSADSVDAVLIVNAYHEMRDYDAMLRSLFRALKAGGRLAIIDEPSESGRERQYYHSNHEIPEALVREDAERNGFHFLRRPKGFREGTRSEWYFLLFEKPTQATANVLPMMIGKWEFQLGVRTGTRTVRPLYGNYAVEFREAFDGTDLEAKGFLVYDPDRDQYFAYGVHNRPGATEASLGKAGSDGSIIFRPLQVPAGDPTFESHLRVESRDRFRYTLYQANSDGTWKEAWQAAFTRMP